MTKTMERIIRAPEFVPSNQGCSGGGVGGCLAQGVQPHLLKFSKKVGGGSAPFIICAWVQPRKL